MAIIHSMAFPGFERVACFPTAAEAEVVRGLLNASAIDARIEGTNSLAREHIPSGEIAVLVPASDVARAREIIASARVPEEPGAAARRQRPVPVLWKSAVVVGLSFIAVGAVAVFLAPGARDASGSFLVMGALLATVGALAGRLERRDRGRSRD